MSPDLREWLNDVLRYWLKGEMKVYGIVHLASLVEIESADFGQRGEGQVT